MYAPLRARASSRVRERLDRWKESPVERELSRGLEAIRAEARREERGEWGSQAATECCCDALYSTERVGLNTF